MIEKQKILAELKKLRPYYKTAGIIVGGLCLFGLVLHFFSTPDKTIVKAHQQIVSLAQEIRSFYRIKPDAWGLNTVSAIKNNLVSNEMIDGQMLKNALGKEVLLGADIFGNVVMPGNRNAVIVYKNLSKKECEALAIMPFDEKMQLSLSTITIVNKQEYKFVWGGENSLPLLAKKAKEICEKNNDILWEIYL